MVRIGLASLILAVFPVVLLAQRPDALTLSAGMARLEGRDRDLQYFLAIGSEVQLRYSPVVRGGPAVGIGYHWLRHSQTHTGLSVRGLFVDARYGFGSGFVIPYLTARHSHLHWTGERFGASMSAGGGLMVAVGSRVQLDVAAAFAVIYRSPTTFPKAPHATGLALRLGIGAVL